MSARRRNILARRAPRGFTLIELIVGGVVVSIIGAGIVSAVSSMLKAKARAVARQQAFSRADAAGARIATDIASVVRDADLQQCRVQISDGPAGPFQRDVLMVLTRSLRLVRGREELPEGGEYEAAYKIDGAGSAMGLWRRCDPAFDRAQDAGGIASLLAPSVTSFSVEASDGKTWFTTWDSDSDGLPHAIRVVIRAQSDDSSADATVRRVVAIDRTPIPPDTTESSTSSQTGEGSSGGSAGTGGSGQ